MMRQPMDSNKRLSVTFTAGQLSAISNFLDELRCLAIQDAACETSSRRRSAINASIRTCNDLRNYIDKQLEIAENTLPEKKWPRIALTRKEVKSLVLIVHSHWNSALNRADEFAADGNYHMADEGLEYADKVLQLKNKLTDYRSELEKSDAP